MVPDFPYIKAIKINDCYTYKDLYVQVFEEEPFRHLILTGKNGSGKSTILNGIGANLEMLRNKKTNEEALEILKGIISRNNTLPVIPHWRKTVQRLNRIEVKYTTSLNSNEHLNSKTFVCSYFKAYRRTKTHEVTTITTESELEGSLNKYGDFYDGSEIYDHQNGQKKQFSEYFKQYLINKKVNQAFDQIESNQQGFQQSQHFFETITNLFQYLFEDKGLKLTFVREQFEYFLSLSDGRKITFNQLPEGFSALLNIITELLMKVDIIRRKKGDYSFDPPGIVLIDEPEVHLHLEMQYQVLPVLTKLFPNIQFIAATHSPAVISSIPNATIYDLSSQVTRKEQVAGSSFSELMLTHFGLENEFSPVADKIIDQVNSIIENVQDKQAAKAQLKQILDANRKVLTPSLQLELESAILELEND